LFIPEVSVQVQRGFVVAGGGEAKAAGLMCSVT